MNVKVKICGIRKLEHAQIATDAGVDFLGFNFVPTSKRFIDPFKAKKIISMIPITVQIVGVFQNQTLNYINELIKYLLLDLVQLHGKEDIAFIKKVKTNVIKKIKEEPIPKNIPFYLLDRVEQGRGEMIDLSIAKHLSKSVSLFIAGNLTPENVGDIVKIVEPYAVDVAGGIEIDGKPHAEKIINFITNAKAIRL